MHAAPPEMPPTELPLPDTRSVSSREGTGPRGPAGGDPPPADPGPLLDRLRRRLWIERGIFLAVLLGGATLWAFPHLRPRVWAIYVNGRPVAAARDRAAAADLLERLRRRAGDASAEFVESVRIAPAPPERAPLLEPEAALARLDEALTLRAPRGVLYIDELPAVALPSAEEAHRLLARLRAEAAAGLPELEGAPRFRQRVEVRTEPAPEDLWADADTAEALLRGETGEPPIEERVRPGDTAWEIARRRGVSLAALEAANPGVDLHRLRAGDTLRIAPHGETSAAPLLTVIAEAREERTEPVPFPTRVERSPKMYVGKRILKQAGRPGRRRVRYRLRYENGRLVAREAVERRLLVPPQAKIVVLGGLPRPGVN